MKALYCDFRREFWCFEYLVTVLWKIPLNYSWLALICWKNLFNLCNWCGQKPETKSRKEKPKKSRLVSLPVCGKVCWESRCLWFWQVSNSGNSQINSQESKNQKVDNWNSEWFFDHSLSLVFAHLCLTLLDFRRVFVTATVFFHVLPRTLHFGGRFLCCSARMVFGDGPPGAGWKVTSSHIPWSWEGRGWKQRMLDGTACHESECWVFGVEMHRYHDAITTMRWHVFIEALSRSQRCRRLHRCGYTVPRALLQEKKPILPRLYRLHLRRSKKWIEI